MELVEKVFELADEHGQESEAGMQIGDLEEALRIAWKVMTPVQRCQAYEEIRATVFGNEAT